LQLETEEGIDGEETLAADDATRTGTTTAGAAPSVGDVVGRYVVLSKLGAGAMGVVMAAYDPELDRKMNFE
jgi:hypothetical protein